MKEYTDVRDAVFGELYDIMSNDKDVILLVTDTGFLLYLKFKQEFPNQFYNTGVTEQNTISVAAGLALSGKKVFVFGISSFLTLRAYEQIKIDICSMNLPVTILGMGTGYGYSYDGPTHHIVEDIAIMNSIPNLTILSPSDCFQTAKMIHWAYNGSPNYIRIDKEIPSSLNSNSVNEFNGFRIINNELHDVTFVSTGIMVEYAIKIARELSNFSISSRIVDLYRLKPLNKLLLIENLKSSKVIVVLEEHNLIGGIGSMVYQLLYENRLNISIRSFGIHDKFQWSIGNREYLRQQDGFSSKEIVKNIKEIFGVI